MSTERKAVKIVSLIIVALGIFALVAGFKSLVTGTAGKSTYSLFGIIIHFVFSLGNLLIGFLGIKGANTPSKIAHFNTACLVFAVMLVVSAILIYAVFQYAVSIFIVVIVLYLACLAVGFVFGRKVLEQGRLA